jgi:hypothetical protein
LRDEDLVIKKFSKHIPKSGIVASFIRERPRNLKEMKLNKELDELTEGNFKYESMLKLLTHPSLLDNSPNIEVEYFNL